MHCIRRCGLQSPRTNTGSLMGLLIWIYATSPPESLVCLPWSVRKKIQTLRINCNLFYFLSAMGYPGTALEKAWRNSKEEVCRFLQVYHNNNYLVVNVVSIHFCICFFRLFSYTSQSERIYDPLPFQRVEYFGWPDHHPPSLSLLLACVQRIDQWLLADPQNIVAVHCMVFYSSHF